jgi:Fe-S oxidoreductase
MIFNDTFTNYYNPGVGVAGTQMLQVAGCTPTLAPNVCCGRPAISKGLLANARKQARRNTALLYAAAASGQKILFCEPSCLSAVREDAPSLLRGDEQTKAKVVADACMLFEDFLEAELASGRRALRLHPRHGHILLHGHCHQKAMGLLPAAKALLSRIPGATVIDPDAGCCGMAGSFGYSREHFDVSRAIGERKLFPALRSKPAGTAVVAAGVSCRHQVRDFTGEQAIHPAILLQSAIAPHG